MSSPDQPDDSGDDQRQPVEAKEALDLPEQNIEAPSAPADQPPLPDFNS